MTTYAKELIRLALLAFWSLLFTSCSSPDTHTVAEVPEIAELFSLLDSSETGIRFVNLLEENEDWNILRYEYLYNGGGVAAGDINNDGLIDLYFVSNNGSDRLYLNKGHFKFEDISAKAGIDLARGHKTGVAMADLNGDGLLDIHVCRSALKDPEQRRNLVYINNGDLTFTEKAHDLGLDDPSYSTQAYFFDMDKDGDLDMYLVNHPADMGEANNIRVMRDPQGKLVVKQSDDLTHVTDCLYRNDVGKFKDVSERAGIRNEAFGLSAMIGDISGDGIPDIYVCNDYVKPDQLYIAQGDGTYTDEIDRYFEHTTFSSMGSDMADINNDGTLDMMTADMTARDHHRYHSLGMATNLDKHSKMIAVGLGAQFSSNTVQLNNGNESFSDICHLAGMAYTDWSWSPLLMDLDNDGWKDAWVSNGYVRDVTDNDYQRYLMDSLQKELNGGRITLIQWLKSIPSVKTRSFLFRNEHDLTFTDRSTDWNSGPPAFSNGSAYADLDNDGYLEIITNNINDAPFILRNNGAGTVANEWIRFKLGPRKGGTTIGTTVLLEMEDGSKQIQRIQPERGFLSSSEPIAHFGIGKGRKIKSAAITWPDGNYQLVDRPEPNILHEITQPIGLSKAPLMEARSKAFTDRTRLLPPTLTHIENAYNDFKREPLLYHKLSEDGPGAAVADVNGDGLDDIFIGGALGQPSKLFIQLGNGEFAGSVPEGFERDKVHEDVCALFLDVDGDGDQDLFVGSGGNERPDLDPAYADRLYLNDGNGSFTRDMVALPKAFNSTSCVAASDVDGDGDLDLFVGARSTPGRYPTTPSSIMLRNDGGRFTEVTDKWSDGLRSMGMATDARFADLDKDGAPELVIAGDWMPLTVFTRKDGRYVNVTNEYGLGDTQGWWCSIDIADIDNDGYPEILAGNLGLNTALRASKEQPTTMYYKDFDRNGTVDAVLCNYVNGGNYPVQMRDRLLDQMVMLKKRFLRYSTYADATIEMVFKPEELKDAAMLKANTFANTLFMNKGGKRFEAVVLPNQAQLSAGNAAKLIDADGDGKMDVLVAGNLYGSDIQFGRYDAGMGSFLKGDGSGGLQIIPANESGLSVRGNVRGLLPIRIKGRSFLLVVRNNERCGLVELTADPEISASKPVRRGSGP